MPVLNEESDMYQIPPGNMKSLNVIPPSIMNFAKNDEVILKIHSGNVLTELMACFKAPDITLYPIEIKMILPNGKEEQGQGSGVFRDCLSEYWSIFYEQCTLGAVYKVPIIRHDYPQEE